MSIAQAREVSRRVLSGAALENALDLLAPLQFPSVPADEILPRREMGLERVSRIQQEPDISK